jgi:hypothetical protein
MFLPIGLTLVNLGNVGNRRRSTPRWVRTDRLRHHQHGVCRRRLQGLEAASAEAANMTTIAIPNRRFPPAEEAVGRTALVIDSLEQLEAERLDWLTLAQS